ncbi:hypothetical protein V6N13_073573 [Hibiscus sabdariffa]|uniref:Late embryogenesis abundant protein LEA-2 subgroup domain-containing protein n=2 Tax=Hibiscus sabdariffa TaxID=183260 RepID=A0ABR2B173_9ROSI
MAEQEQAKPFVLVAFGARSGDNDEAFSMQQFSEKRRSTLCIGFIAAVFLVLAIVVLTLFLTVFHIQDPIIRLNSMTIQSLEMSPKGTLRIDGSVKLLADVSVKNPNAASFKLDNGTVTVYYGGRVVGEGSYFPGKARPRRTLRRNVTVEIDPEEFLSDPGFVTDIIGSKGLNISSYTRISGRIDIMNIIKRNVLVKFNCSTTFRLSPSTGGLHGDKCKPQLDF